MPHILILEDDISFSRILESFLKRHGFEVTLAPAIKSGLRKLQEERFDLLLLDYRLPDGTGLDILNIRRVRDRELPAIIMTGFHDIKTAVQAIKHGAFDFITKPINQDEMLMIIKKALNDVAPKQASSIPEKPSFVAGQSEAARQINEYIKLVAPTDMSVLITGESGTGKEQAARMIHEYSKRSESAFIAVDCGALSAELAGSEIFGHVKGAFTGALQDKKGKLEAARGGTLFLDEVGNLSYDIQVKLLRALQEKEIQPVGSNRTIKTDARIITATNDDLLQSVNKGTFREDLYHRLNEFKIQLPSLSERGEDFELFVAHFMELANRELGKSVRNLSEEVKDLFKKYHWPGNLRELKNILKRAVLLTQSETISAEALPDEMVLAVNLSARKNASGLKAIQEVNEKDMILRTLKEVKYNKSKAARLLNIDRKTLYYKMAKYQIEG